MCVRVQDAEEYNMVKICLETDVQVRVYMCIPFCMCVYHCVGGGGGARGGSEDGGRGCYFGDGDFMGVSVSDVA